MANKHQRLTVVFAALADPTRRRILERLSRRGDCRVTALAKPFRISLPAISKHLRVLERADLIRRERDGREHRIRANTRGVQEAQTWIARYVECWDSRFDALDELLKRESAGETSS